MLEPTILTPTYSARLNVFSNRDKSVNLESTTAEESFDEHDMTIFIEPDRDDDGSSSLESAVECYREDGDVVAKAPVKIKRCVSAYEKNLSDKYSTGTGNSPDKPDSSQDATSKDGHDHKRMTALSRYQNHLSQLKLIPVVENKPPVEDLRPLSPQPTPSRPSKIPVLDFSKSSSMSSDGFCLSSHMRPPLPLTPSVINIGVGSMDFTDGSVQSDQLPAHLSNTASTLLMTAALNALTQAQSAHTAGDPLTTALAAASAQILAAALNKAPPAPPPTPPPTPTPVPVQVQVQAPAPVVIRMSSVSTETDEEPPPESRNTKEFHDRMRRSGMTQVTSHSHLHSNSFGGSTSSSAYSSAAPSLDTHSHDRRTDLHNMHNHPKVLRPQNLATPTVEKVVKPTEKVVQGDKKLSPVKPPISHPPSVSTAGAGTGSGTGSGVTERSVSPLLVPSLGIASASAGSPHDSVRKMTALSLAPTAASDSVDEPADVMTPKPSASAGAKTVEPVVSVTAPSAVLPAAVTASSTTSNQKESSSNNSSLHHHAVHTSSNTARNTLPSTWPDLPAVSTVTGIAAMSLNDSHDSAENFPLRSSLSTSPTSAAPRTYRMVKTLSFSDSPSSSSSSNQFDSNNNNNSSGQSAEHLAMPNLPARPASIAITAATTTMRTDHLTHHSPSNVSLAGTLGSGGSFTPPSFKDYHAKYTMGLKAVQSARAESPMSRNSKERNPVNDSSQDLDTSLMVSSDVSSLNHSRGASNKKTLSRHDTTGAAGNSAYSAFSALSASTGIGSMMSETTINTGSSNTEYTNPDHSILLSPAAPHIERRNMMDTLLARTDSVAHRLKVESEYKAPVKVYTKQFHSVDPRVFEAEFEKNHPLTPSNGANLLQTKSSPRVQYRNSIMALINSTPNFVTTPRNSEQSDEEEDRNKAVLDSGNFFDAASVTNRDEDPFGQVEQEEAKSESERDSPLFNNSNNNTTTPTSNTDGLDFGADALDEKEEVISNFSADVSVYSDSLSTPPKPTISAATADMTTLSQKERNPLLLRKLDSTRSVHRSFKYDEANRAHILGRQTNSIKGQNKLHDTALEFRQDACLNSVDAKNLKLASVANRNMLVGWQILILKKGELSLLGLAVITGVRTNLFMQTEYRISTDVSLDCWVRLKRGKGMGGTEFQPLRKVLTTKQCNTRMRVISYKKNI